VTSCTLVSTCLRSQTVSQLQISALFQHVIRLACWLLWRRVDDFLFVATIPPHTHILTFLKHRRLRVHTNITCVLFSIVPTQRNASVDQPRWPYGYAGIKWANWRFLGLLYSTLPYTDSLDFPKCNTWLSLELRFLLHILVWSWSTSIFYCSKNSPSHFYFPANHWNISREVFASRHFGITGKRSVRRLGIELSASEPHNHCSKTDLYDLSSLTLNLFRGWLIRTPASNSGLPDSDIGFRGLGKMH
jgi:hypothetical protein